MKHELSVAFFKKRVGQRVRFDGELVIKDDSSPEFISEASMDGVFISNSDGITHKMPVHPPGIVYVGYKFM